MSSRIRSKVRYAVNGWWKGEQGQIGWEQCSCSLKNGEMLWHHKYLGKILNQAAGILTDFEAFFSEFSSQFGLEWETVKIKGINKQDVWHGNRQAHKFTKKLPSIHAFTQDCFIVSFNIFHYCIVHWLYSGRTTL